VIDAYAGAASLTGRFARRIVESRGGHVAFGGGSMNQINSRFEGAIHLNDAAVHHVALSLRKRLFDLAFAALALLIFAPLLFLLALAIKVETPGPVLFRQDRTGLGGRTFTIYKLRSMRIHEPDAVVRQASRGDDRITPIGAVIRALSLDELPQLLNVIKGDMSLVGPRPHAISHDTEWGCAIPTYGQRFRARPGLTGLAQVNGYRGKVDSLRDVDARIRADIEYIETWSFGRDMQIILRTLPLLFADPNAV
jgi:putative colanic acid biosynthesis UDP-glucose lipid carrier transferase